MAKSKSTSAIEPRRASQRRALPTPISINLANDLLKNLMVEQCKDGGNYLTVYRATRAELVAAGVPEAAFPKEGTVAKFPLQTLNACCTGSHERLLGSMQSTAVGFELEVNWGTVMPYLQGSHQAVHEIARTVMLDILAWIDDDRKTPNLAYPLEMLAADPRSSYKPPPSAPRLEISAEFHKKLSDYAHDLYHFVFRNCELIQSTDAAAKQPTRLRLIKCEETSHG